MTGETVARVGAIAEQRWGLFTTAQAEDVGVNRQQVSRMASTGAIIRVAQGVYRVAGAPELEHEWIYAAWLALGGAAGSPAAGTVPPVVAAGVTATVIHGIGMFYPDGAEFIVPTRRGTRLGSVRLRTRQLSLEQVTWVDGMPTLTVEATIADMVGQWVDLSLVADTLRDAVIAGKVTKVALLVRLLDPLAAANGAADGAALVDRLYEIAGLPAPATA